MSKERRVLHVLEATRGGTRTHVMDLLPALAARGWSCGLVYSSQRNPDFASDAQILESHGVRTWDVAMRRGPHPDDARAVRDVLAVARAFGPSLLHAHSSKAGFLARLASPLARTRAIYTPHCVAFETGLPHLQRHAARWAEVALSPFTARLIAVSQAELRALRRVLPVAPERITLIRNGVDAALFDGPQVLGSDHSVLTIGCFGRLCAQKNQALLLRALGLLRADGISARLLLVGGGEDEAMLRQLADALGVASSVQWTGEVEDARPFYGRCDVVAVPSRWEGCPYSLLEAMASRRAIVASDIAPLREILAASGEPAGILCPPNPAAFARAMLVARRFEARTSLGNAARARVENLFRLDRMVDETARVYEEVAGAST